MESKQSATNRPSLLVYRASAGSGKTFTLAARYIALLMDGNRAATILAVTFTNKATAEMKGRIVEYLYRMRTNIQDAALQPFIRTVKSFMTTSLSPDKMQQRAALQLKSILEDYDHFNVTTIDAFLQMLLGEVARTADLQTNYRVELRDAEVIDEAIDLMLAEFNDMSKGLKEKLKAFIRQALDEERNWDIRRQLKEIATQLRNDHYLLVKDKLDRFFGCKGNLAGYRKLLNSLSQKGALGETKDLLEKFKRAFPDENFENGCGRSAGAYRTLIKNIGESLEDYRTVKEPFKGLTEAALNYLQNDFAVKYQGQYNGAQLADALIQLNDMCAKCRYQINSIEACRKRLGEMELLNDIGGQVDRINAEANRMLLSTTPILLHHILEQGDDFAFVLEKAGTRFDHIMIDEFQDTSRMQWDNFLPLVDELLSRGGTTLLVGDVKQSIYRWRGGDWEILKNIEQGNLRKYFTDGRAQVESLTRNFRSDTNIVLFNLDLFPKAAKELDALHDLIPTKNQQIGEHDIQDIYDEGFTPEKAEEYCRNINDKSGYVDIRLYPFSQAKKKDTKEGEKGRVEKDADELILEDFFKTLGALRARGVKENDILVLVRGRKDIDKIISYDEAHKSDDSFLDVRFVSADAYRLDASVSVNMIVSAIRWLNDWDDKISLTYLAHHYQTYILKNAVSWYDAGHSPLKYLPMAFSKSYLLRNEPLYELVEHLSRLLLYVPDGVDGKRHKVLTDDSYVFCFMDRVMAYLDGNAGDLKAFIDYWDDHLCAECIPTPEVANGIRLMTIHKAKGLQAHTVIVPFCDWDVEKDSNIFLSSSKDFLWCKVNDDQYSGSNSGLEPIPAVAVEPTSKMKESIFQEDYAREHQLRRIDNLNLMYVAFTRPVHNLIVMGKVDSQKKNTKKGGPTPENLPCNTVADVLAKVYGKEKEIIGFDYEENAVQIYHEGELVGGIEKGEDVKAENRLKLPMQSVEVQLSNEMERMNFRQSNESQQFLEQTENLGAKKRLTYDDLEAEYRLPDTSGDKDLPDSEDLPPLVGDLDADNRKPVDAEAEKRQEEYVKKGNLLHFVFQNLRTADDLSETVDGLRRNGIIDGDKEEQEVRRLVTGCLNNKEACKWFDGSWTLYRECTILRRGKDGVAHHLRPDRVMIRKDETVVVDYKAATPKEEHQAQVREYMNLLLKMGYPNVKGYLWYLYPNKVEEVPLQPS